MKSYLTALTSTVLTHFLGSLYFVYQRREADEPRKHSTQMDVEAQQDIIERLEKLVAKATFKKECK